MARAALKWSLEDLARAANVHRNTVNNFENERYAGTPDVLEAIQRALERAGMIFVAENGEGPGVRLKKTT
ncbi:helix-turn-helix domain-containing protein [Pararhizobium capsulatum]|uniref:helix-turn-helix domain-containing protein n=1 Tax=Pararhizobium capsulatum TaxID=34014 RepID=UPI0027D784A8|nr:helix-turn-helix transcriptional regulator [Pararhizobium capsulatum]